MSRDGNEIAVGGWRLDVTKISGGRDPDRDRPIQGGAIEVEVQAGISRAQVGAGGVIAQAELERLEKRPGVGGFEWGDRGETLRLDGLCNVAHLIFTIAHTRRRAQPARRRRPGRGRLWQGSDACHLPAKVRIPFLEAALHLLELRELHLKLWHARARSQTSERGKHQASIRQGEGWRRAR